MKTITFSLRAATVCWLSVVLSASASAASTATISDEDLLLARNPVIIRSRLRLANEYTEAGGGNTRDKLVLGGTASTKVSDSVSMNLDYKAVLNTVGNTKLLNTLEPSVGWLVGDKKNIGLSASCELPLYESGADWVAKAGMIWFF